MTPREAFETHLRSLPHFHKSPLAWTYERDTLGNYCNCRVGDMWHGWQAATQAVSVNWSDVGRLIDASYQAFQYKLMVGSSNWAAFICKAMTRVADHPVAQHAPVGDTEGGLL